MHTYNHILTALLITCELAVSSQNAEFVSYGKINYPLTDNDIQMLDTIQHKTFLYFMGEHQLTTGLVKDRSAATSPSSIAATGFGIPAFAIGAEHKWITREQAAAITLKIMEFFMNSPQSNDANGTGYKGFYYHFLKLETGKREWNCELSTIDTGILMMGIIFARNYYNGKSKEETRIRELSRKLLERVDWDFAHMPAAGRFANTISMGWTPEKGMNTYGYAGYDEALFLYILAAGSGMKDAENCYKAWLSTYKWYTPYPGLSHVAFPPLFGHQFTGAFIDLRGLADDYMLRKGLDYFENSRRATIVQRKYATDNPKGWVGYDSLCWGISACDGPPASMNFGDKKFLGYAGRGTSGPDYTLYDDGTIAPYAALSSIPFTPAIVFPEVRSVIQKYGKNLWGKYGFYDAFNPTAKWVDNDFLGIDEGPMLMMIENFRTGLVWNYMMKDQIIQKGLKRLGFKYLAR